MVFYKNGVKRASLGPFQAGPSGVEVFGLRFFDDDGITTRLELGCLDDLPVGNGPGLRVFDREGRLVLSVMSFETDEGPVGRVQVVAPDGTQLVQITQRAAIGGCIEVLGDQPREGLDISGEVFGGLRLSSQGAEPYETPVR
jgi:hypothetical protein